MQDEDFPPSRFDEDDACTLAAVGKSWVLWMPTRFGWIRHKGSTVQVQSDTHLYIVVAEHVYIADRKIRIQQAFGRDC